MMVSRAQYRKIALLFAGAHERLSYGKPSFFILTEEIRETTKPVIPGRAVQGCEGTRLRQSSGVRVLPLMSAVA